MTLRLKDFINNDLKVFSNLDNVRSIPSIIDGFKDSQRKAVYGLLDHGTSEIRVSQLGSSAALKSQYQHGETSMCDTIVGLAQSYPGSNNLNLFEPIGQFGSILSSESASHRYIYTKPSEYLRKIIRKEDDIILKYREEEGEKLEPLSYYPIIPLWLVNGSVGIGTGHSVRILARDPKKVSDLISRIVSGTKVQQRTIDDALTPYFKGWKGIVTKGDSDTQWEITGSIEKVNTTTLRITELPITYDVDKFKGILINLMDSGIVRDYDNNSTESGFDFVVSVPREVGKKDLDELIKIFKLSVKVGENVTLWDTRSKLVRFESVYDALLEFIAFREKIYTKRKEKQIQIMESEIEWLKTKIDFIQYWNTKMKDPHKKSKPELSKELEKVVNLEYIDRLLSMQISSLTMDQVKKLESELKTVENQKLDLESKSADQLYREDLVDI